MMEQLAHSIPLTVFTYHCRKPLEQKTILKIMDFIGTTIDDLPDNELFVGGSRQFENEDEEMFWKFYNKLNHWKGEKQ